MIALRQMAAAMSAVDELGDMATVLKRIEDRLVRAGLFAAHDDVRKALTEVESARLNLDRDARETFVALRQGKPVPP